jgi:hypothetical protein
MSTMNTSTYETRGLVGWLTAAGSGLRRSARSAATAAIGTPITWMVRLLFLAAGTLLWRRATGAEGATSADAVVALALGGAALLAEYQVGREVATAWRRRDPAKLAAFCMVYAVAFGFIAMQMMSSAGELQDRRTGVQAAAYETQQSTRTERDLALEALKSARDSVALLRRERWEPLPQVAGRTVTSVADAAALLAKAKSNTRLWDLTKGCSSSSGPTTRAYCAEYADAQSALAAAEKRELVAPTLVTAEAQLAAREAAYAKIVVMQPAKPVVAAERGDVRLLVAYGGLGRQAAADLQALLTTVFISLLLPMLGMLERSHEMRDEPRRAWGIVEKLRGAIWGRRHTTTVLQPLDGVVQTRNPETLVVEHRRVISASASA